MMVDKISQKIRAHGYSFEVLSEQPITDAQENVLVEALKKHDPEMVRLLAQGKEGESPLKIVVAPRAN